MNKFSASQSDIHRFISKYLRTDGVFILRVVTVHAGVVFGTDLIANLYRSFYGIEETEMQCKKKDEKNNKNKESESAAPAIVRHNEDTVDSENWTEQNVINHFAQQLAHIRQRNKNRNSRSEDSSNLYRESMGQALTLSAHLQAIQDIRQQSAHGPVPVMNEQVIPKP